MSNFNSYSQYGEDYVVYSFFKKRTTGILIDIGAFDGLRKSARKAAAATARG